jgi:hypothetical protein
MIHHPVIDHISVLELLALRHNRQRKQNYEADNSRQ